MARKEISGELLEFIAALRRLAEKFPEAPRKEGCLGGFPGHRSATRTMLLWRLRMEMVVYYTQTDSEWTRFERVVRELERRHPNLISGTYNQSAFVFILDSPELSVT